MFAERQVSNFKTDQLEYVANNLPKSIDVAGVSYPIGHL